MIFRKARTFLSIFRKSPLYAWDVLQLKLENRLGRSVHSISGRRRRTRRFEVAHTEEVPSHFRAYGNYVLDPALLGDQPIAFSGGVGEYIDFDRALLDRHDVRLFLFDPTPSSKRFIEAAGLPINAKFQAVAIGDHDGEIVMFSDNLDSDFETSLSLSSQNRTFSNEGRAVPCRRIETLMREVGVSHLDVLKLDIEGAAIAALRDMLAAGIRPTQIAAEFERPTDRPGVRAYLKELAELFGALTKAGYRLYRTRPDTFGFQVEILAVLN